MKLFEYDISCRDNLDYMEGIETHSINLVITSPPYNLGKEYEKSLNPFMDYMEMQENVISECARVLSPSGSICWQVGNNVSSNTIFPLDIMLHDIFTSYDFHLRNRIIWHFEHGLHCKKRFSGRYETIMWYTRDSGDNYTFNLDPVRVPSKYPDKKHYKGPKKGELSGNPLGKNPGDVWIFPNVKHNHVEKTEHPCQFPVELVERFVLSLTNEGDSVFDPYMGVGTSVIAALMHGRKGYGCDTMMKYVKIAQDRINQLKKGTLKTRPMNKPVYNPKSKEN